MWRVRYLNTAEDDLNEIFDYIHERGGSVDAALAFVEAVDRHIADIAAQPFELGRERLDLGADLRSLPHGRYLFILRYVGHVLEVIRILEGHQDIEAQFSDESGDT